MKSRKQQNSKVALTLLEEFWQNWVVCLPVVLVKMKSTLVFKNVSRSLEKVKSDMWFDDENELLNADFVWNNTLEEEMSVSIHNYKINKLHLFIYFFFKNMLMVGNKTGKEPFLKYLLCLFCNASDIEIFLIDFFTNIHMAIMLSDVP